MNHEIIYGTAWKEEYTEECVFNAIKEGFRAIDTANQRKHYNEAGAGQGIARAYKELNVVRNDLFIQTKFTFAHGQDHRLPFDKNDPYQKQVRSSVLSSLEHLHTDYLDSLILHGPFTPEALSEEDREVWQGMESLFNEGLVKNIGVSNVSLEQLSEIYEFATVRPRFAQIRCFAVRKWEKDIRNYCNEHNIIFQGFSLLTANRQFLGGEGVRVHDRTVPKLVFNNEPGENSVIGRLMKETGKTEAQIIFRFCRQIGILPVTGTRTIENMRLNLDIGGFELTESQIEMIENIAVQ